MKDTKAEWTEYIQVDGPSQCEQTSNDFTERTKQSRNMETAATSKDTEGEL